MLPAAPDTPSAAGRLAALALALLACVDARAQDEATEVIYRIDSFRVPCVGVAPMSCLRVRRGEPATGEWQNFYDQIEGFSYEPGYLYRLRVRVTPRPRDPFPADASTIRFELVELIEKIRDPRLALHDIWVLRRILGNSVDAFDPASRTRQPYLELNLTRRDYLGNDGCNDIRGELLGVSERQLRLGYPTSAGLVPVCGDGVLQQQFWSALTRVAGWRRDGLWLTLLDDDGAELLALHKTD